MFTGIVEDVGTIERITEVDDGRRISIRSRVAGSELREGASISVDGACLTVVSSDRHTFSMEIVGTTLSRTIAATYEEGARVNLERAARADSRLDGHLVQGHVDGVGELLDVEEEGNHHLLRFRIPEAIWTLTVPHGSIAVNGVSFTVNRLVDGCRCEVAVIPHTWSHTNFSTLQAGDPVNVEGDLIGKYVGRYLDSLTIERFGASRLESGESKA